MRKRPKKPATLWEAVQGRLWSACSREVLSPVTMGLAHDLNNLLTGVCSMSELSLLELPAEHPMRERLEIVRSHGAKAAELVRKLFLEHQANPGQREHHDLNTLAKANFDLARQVIPKAIKTALALASEPLPVFMDAVAFRTVFLHLAMNAAEAIDGQGKIECHTALRARLPKGANYIGAKPRGPVASIELTDTGRGFKREFLQKIGKSLFTTKVANEGAGLGLHLAKEFAQASGGGLSIRSKRGTTLTLWFPLADFSERASLKS